MSNIIVVIGSINVDVFNISPKKIYKDAICPGSKLTDSYILPGGKGANQAAVASWLGAKTYMLGCVGNDEMGYWLLSILQSQGVDVSKIKKTSKPTSIITINDHSSKYKYLVSPGANTNVSIAYVKKHLDLIKKADIVLTQLETPLNVVKFIAKVCKKHNITSILNPDPKIKFDKNLFSQFSYVTPNQNEISDTNIKWLVKNTNTKVIQTVGKHGAIHWKKDGTKKIYLSSKQKVISTIGAGDTFSGTLAYCLLNNMNLHKAIKKAVKNSSWSVRQLGAQKLPRRKL